MAKIPDRNMLSQSEVFKVARWLECKEQQLNALRPTVEATAEMAAKDLGFPVSSRNLRTVIESAELKIQFGGPDGRSAVGASLWNRRLATLRQIVTDLYKKVGEPVPQELTDELW